MISLTIARISSRSKSVLFLLFETEPLIRLETTDARKIVPVRAKEDRIDQAFRGLRVGGIARAETAVYFEIRLGNVLRDVFLERRIQIADGARVDVSDGGAHLIFINAENAEKIGHR